MKYRNIQKGEITVALWCLAGIAILVFWGKW